MLRRRDVALGAVGEVEGDGRCERALGFLFEACERVDFIGNTGDANIANADGLQDQLGLGAFVQEDLFARVNFLLCLGQSLGLGDDALRPFEHLLVGRAKFQ